ncbi:unnamed protein product [Mortierella alpina]
MVTSPELPLATIFGTKPTAAASLTIKSASVASPFPSSDTIHCPRALDSSLRPPFNKPVHHCQHLPDPPQRLYQCPYCPKAFSHLEHSSHHIRTHTDEKLHVCHYSGCNRSFARSDELSRHLRAHHNSSTPSRDTLTLTNTSPEQSQFSAPVMMHSTAAPSLPFQLIEPPSYPHMAFNMTAVPAHQSSPSLSPSPTGSPPIYESLAAGTPSTTMSMWNQPLPSSASSLLDPSLIQASASSVAMATSYSRMTPQQLPFAPLAEDTIAGMMAQQSMGSTVGMRSYDGSLGYSLQGSFSGVHESLRTSISPSPPINDVLKEHTRIHDVNKIRKRKAKKAEDPSQMSVKKSVLTPTVSYGSAAAPSQRNIEQLSAIPPPLRRTSDEVASAQSPAYSHNMSSRAGYMLPGAYQHSARNAPQPRRHLSSALLSPQGQCTPEQTAQPCDPGLYSHPMLSCSASHQRQVNHMPYTPLQEPGFGGHRRAHQGQRDVPIDLKFDMSGAGTSWPMDTISFPTALNNMASMHSSSTDGQLQIVRHRTDSLASASSEASSASMTGHHQSPSPLSHMDFCNTPPPHLQQQQSTMQPVAIPATMGHSNHPHFRQSTPMYPISSQPNDGVPSQSANQQQDNASSQDLMFATSLAGAVLPIDMDTSQQQNAPRSVSVAMATAVNELKVLEAEMLLAQKDWNSLPDDYQQRSFEHQAATSVPFSLSSTQPYTLSNISVDYSSS